MRIKHYSGKTLIIRDQEKRCRIESNSFSINGTAQVQNTINELKDQGYQIQNNSTFKKGVFNNE